MSFKNKLKTYLLANPIDRSLNDPYGPSAALFNTDRETIRSVWRSLRRQGLVEQDTPTHTTPLQTNKKDFKITKDFKTPIKSLDELIVECNVDTSIWGVKSWRCNKKDVGSTKNGITELYTVTAILHRLPLENNIELVKDELLTFINKHATKPISPINVKKADDKCLLEISLPDVHFGKLSWHEETGEDYDLKIAKKAYNKAISSLLSTVDLSLVTRILFPIGNDMIHIDNPNNTTTAGTPQDVDSRFRKILTTVKNLLIETIDSLKLLAPVDVVVVPGNHDTFSIASVAMVLEAYYLKDNLVNIDNSPKLRKYYQYYNVGIMFTHGDKEKQADLPLIFATENPRLWADTYFREIHLGHLHKTKRTNYVSVDTFAGAQVCILPSLSATDYWHFSKGYGTLKQGKAFLYDRSNGKIAEYTTTVKL
jgi:hypothetical protein